MNRVDMTTNDYDVFLQSKANASPAVGIEKPGKLNDRMFPFQKDIVKWALRRGRAAIFADCGLGKSLMQLEWAHNVAKHTKGQVLILAPLAVAEQTVAEGEKFGIQVRLCNSQEDVGQGLNVTNYEKLHKFDPSAFDGVVLDECFAAKTPIDTPRGRMHIEDIRIGDHILNASGVDTVADVHKREVQYAIKVTIGESSYIASPNHPFFTQRGWVGAQDLRPGDRSLGTASAMRMVRERLFPQIPGPVRSEILRDILLSELADGSTNHQSESTQPGSSSEAGPFSICMVEVWEPQSVSGDGKDNSVEPHFSARSEGQDIHPIERGEAQTFRAWGQRTWLDGASEDDAGCAWRTMDSGIQFVTGKADSGLSHLLQARLSASRKENMHRGGWVLSCCNGSENTRCEEGSEAGFTRVESMQVLQPGNPELECLRSSDGKLYFYDIGATRHPSFSIGGHLVHNSSILKSFDGSTKTVLIEAFQKTRFRLACTATPAPNDYMELGNHAEFLGAMTRAEMLAMYFVHDGGDTSQWRIKGHAENAFWDWVCSWGIMLRKPSDLGYEDAGFALPEMVIHKHVVQSTQRPEGMLFMMPAETLQEQRAARRASLNDRVNKVAELVNGSPEPWLVWCELNDEGDQLEKAIQGALQVAGKDDNETKSARLTGFAKGTPRILVSKPSLAGFGLNYQHCANVAFVGLSHSYEQFYQAVRRCWRFGQTRTVHVHIVTSDLELSILDNVLRKEKDSQKMAREMVGHMRDKNIASVRGLTRNVASYCPTEPMQIPSWLTSEDAETAA